MAPGVDTKLDEAPGWRSGSRRQVTFTVDGEPQTIWTTATRVDQAVGALGIDTAGADLSTSRSAGIGREGLAVDVATQKTVTIDAAGERRRVKTTAQTVGEALAAAKITVDADDRLSPAKTAELADGAKVTYTRVDVKAKTKKEKVAFTTRSARRPAVADSRHHQGRHRRAAPASARSPIGSSATTARS